VTCSQLNPFGDSSETLMCPPKGPYALVNQKLTTSFSQIISIMLLSMLSSYDYSKNKCPNFFSAYSGLMALQFTAKY